MATTLVGLLEADCNDTWHCDSSPSQTHYQIPPVYQDNSSIGVMVDFEVLYWYGREGNLGYANPFLVIDSNAGDPSSIDRMASEGVKSLGTSWDLGFRAALGFIACDGWDLALKWTYFKTDQKETCKVSDAFKSEINNFPSTYQMGLTNPWYDAAFQTFGGGSIPLIFNQIKAKWELHLNTIDLELGRGYYLSPCFTFRPFLGLRGAWARTDFSTRSTRSFELNGGQNIILKDQFQTKTWGIGPFLGFSPSWKFSDCFSLFGQVTTSLLWGNFKMEKEEDYFRDLIAGSNEFITIDAEQQIQSSFFQITPILDFALGLKFESCLFQSKLRAGLDFAWEHHVWFEQNHRQQYTTPFQVAGGIKGYQHVREAIGMLSFGGPLLRLYFGF